MSKFSKMKLIPRILLGSCVGVVVILLLIGIYKDNTGEVCSGFMGAKASCVEEILLWPFGLIAIPALLLLGSWLTIKFMSKPIKSKRLKKLNPKN